ncbi:MAG: thioesterase family protein [Vicinamibacterales bacterium]
MFSHQLEVRFRDCDAMGHVNNAVYLTYLEEARFAHWKTLAGRTRAPGVILARVEVDYRKPATYGDILEIQIRLERFGNTSLIYTYVIQDQHGDRIAEARSVLVSYDYATGKPVPVPDDVRTKIIAGLSSSADVRSGNVADQG